MRTRRLLGPLAGCMLGLGCAWLAVSALDPLHAARVQMKASGPPIYLPSPKYVKALALGHRTTLADLLYLWSIQYFGEGGKEGRKRTKWLEQVYDTITDLDPHFRDAYWLGYVSLLQEAHDPRAAFAVVDKALAPENEPGFTLIAIEAAMAARHLHDKAHTMQYLQIAGERGDAVARRLLLRLQDVDTAQHELEGWQQLLDQSTGLDQVVAATKVRDLRAFIDTETLRALVACYTHDHGLPPATLDQLVRGHYLADPQLLFDPEGQPYLYDVRSGLVKSRKPYKNKPPARARLGVDLSQLGRCAPQPSAAAPGSGP